MFCTRKRQPGLFFLANTYGIIKRFLKVRLTRPKFRKLQRKGQETREADRMQYADRTECFIAIRALIGGVKGLVTPLLYLSAECAAPYLALCWYVYPLAQTKCVV